MNRLLTMAAGLIVLAAISYWYYDQTERRQRSAEAMRTELADFLTAQGARYGSLTFDRNSNSVTVKDISWTQEADGMARRLTLDSARIAAGDIEAFRTVFKPASYAPDDARVGEFLKLAAVVELRGLELKHAGGTLAVSRFRLEGPALSQFGFTPSRRGIEKAGTAFVTGDVGKALKFQKGRLEGLKILNAKNTEFTLSTLDLGAFDSGLLDQLAAKQMVLNGDDMSARIEGLAVNGLALERWLNGLQKGDLSMTRGLLSSVALTRGQGPSFDAVKVLGFRLSGAEDRPVVSIDEAALTDLVRVGEFVAAGHLRVQGLEFPVAGEAPWSMALRDMGYDKLRINLVSRSTYDPKSKVSETAQFMVEVENAGRIFGSSRLENVEIGDELRELDLNGFVSGRGIEKLLGTWRLARLEVGYKDLSLIERAFELALKRLGKAPDVLVDDYLVELETLRERYGNGPFMTAFSEQMKIFLEEPNSIVFRMVPPEPVVLAQLALTGFNNPEELAETLGLTVSANQVATE